MILREIPYFSRSSVTNNLITDPDLRRKLQKAATQIGAKSLEDLAVALLDGGYLGKTKSPLEIMRLSRTEVGASLLSQRKEEETDPDFFRRLIPAQQHAVILSLMNDGDSAQRVAGRFWLPVEEVTRVWNRYAQSIGEDVLQVRFEAVVGNLMLRTEDCYSRALANDQPKQAADILFKFTDMMQRLGVIYRAPVKVEFGLTKEAQEEVTKEARRIVELEGKLNRQLIVQDADARADSPTQN